MDKHLYVEHCTKKLVITASIDLDVAIYLTFNKTAYLIFTHVAHNHLRSHLEDQNAALNSIYSNPVTIVVYMTMLDRLSSN